MRILHVIPQFPYFGGRTIVGGHASSLLNLALAQAAAGDEVTIISYVEEGRPGEFTLDDGRVRVHSLFSRARPGTLRFGLAFCRRAIRWAKARRGDFDVVHGHAGFAEYFLVTSELQRVLSCPALHTSYCPIPRGPSRARLPLVHATLRHRAARLDAIAAISRNVADSLRAYGLPGAEIVPPALDVERFKPAGDVAAQRTHLGLGPDEVAILFVGNAKPQKNLSGVLRAFARVRQRHSTARLVVTTELAQSSPDHRLTELRREIADLGLNDGVTQKGIVADMPALMQACDVLVAPFLDTFGPSDYFMAALEAMACGKPVVVSAIGGMPEVVHGDCGFLVDPYDDQALARAIATLLDDDGWRRRAGEQARQHAEQNFDADVVATRYRNLYARIGA